MTSKGTKNINRMSSTENIPDPGKKMLVEADEEDAKKLDDAEA